MSTKTLYWKFYPFILDKDEKKCAFCQRSVNYFVLLLENEKNQTTLQQKGIY
jgi:hypothetical protein